MLTSVGADARISAVIRYALGAVIALYLILFLGFGFVVSPWDYDHLSSYYEMAWRYWVAGPALPHYNPFLCGGRTLGGDPQIPIYHPLVLLVGLLGATWTLKLEMLVQLALGCYGLWRWLERLGAREDGRRWALLLYIAGGGVVARFLVGHVTLGFYFLTPVFFHLSCEIAETAGNRRLRAFTLYTLLFAYSGLYKPNFLIYFVPPLLLEALVRAVLQRRPAVFLAAVAATGIGALVDSVSLLPAAQYFKDFPRTNDTPPVAIPFTALIANLLLPLKAIPKAFYGTRFLQRHEYNVFLGPVALFFVAAGWRAAARTRRAEHWALAAFVFSCALLGCGRTGEGFVAWIPYSWLQTFWPGFASVRVPVRFWYGVYVGLIAWSALGWRAPHRAWLVGVFGVVPLLLQATVNLSKTVVQAEITQWVVPREYPKTIDLEHSETDKPYRHIRAGRGVIECPENLEVFKAPDLVAGPTTALQLSAPGEGEAHWLDWNRIAIQARSHNGAPLRAALNLNHADYWSFEGRGRIVSLPHERLTVSAEDGALAGQLTFRQPWLTDSLRLSGLALALFAAFGAWVFRPGRRLLRIGLTGGVAAGKSRVAAMLREEGMTVIDLDAVGREITDRHPNLIDDVVRLFGPEVAPQGKLDRRKLRDVIFADETRRRELEAILHPPIRREFERECASAEKRGEKAIVCEAALLVEGGYYRKMDALIVVTAPEGVRRERLVARDNITAELADAMLRAQLPQEEKVQVATFVVENSGTEAELREKVRALRAKLAGL